MTRLTMRWAETGRDLPAPWLFAPVRLIGEQHVREDLGFIPSFADWVKAIRPERWMGQAMNLEDILQTSNQAE